MRPREGILPFFRQHFLVAHQRKKIEHALARHAGPLQVAGARLVGARFLFARIGEEAARGEMLPAHDQRHAGIARAGRDGADAEDHRGDQGRLDRRHVFAPLHQMPARHMADFVCHHADQFAGRLDRGDEAGVVEHLLAFGDEGVEAPVVDEVDFHRRRIEPRNPQKRVGIIPQHVLGFCVADDRNALRGGRVCAAECQHGAQRQRVAERRFRSHGAVPHTLH